MVGVAVVIVAGDVPCDLIFPFHELTAQSDLRSRQALQGGLYLLYFGCVFLLQFAVGLQDDVEDFAHHGLCGRTSE